MKVVIQRVRCASVTVDEQIVGEIGAGLLLLVGFGKGDTSEKLRPLAEKILSLRVFSNDSGSFSQSAREIGAGLLIVSQFTLYGDTTKGRRPDFTSALEPVEAQRLYDEFVAIFKGFPEISVQCGVFRKMMNVTLQNDGPVTLIVER